jgi:hypothetical protein
MITKTGNKGFIALKCEDCLEERTVQRNTTLILKDEHPCRSCSNKRNGKLKIGKPAWNSGKTFIPKVFGTSYINYAGYKEIWVGKKESIKYGRKDGYVLEHRKIVQDLIGRPLLKDEIVHHIDCDKSNNSLNNLLLCSSSSEHREIHNTIEKTISKLLKDNILVFEDKQYKIAPIISDDN